MSELSTTQLSVLERLTKHPLLGPGPEYQGDLIHISGPEFHDLLRRKMIHRRKLPKEMGTDGHRENPPYLKFTNRYLISKAGRAALAGSALSQAHQQVDK